MRFTRIATACIAAALALAAVAAHAEVRKWIEADGRVTYSDTRPSATAREAGPNGKPAAAAPAAAAIPAAATAPAAATPTAATPATAATAAAPAAGTAAAGTPAAPTAAAPATPAAAPARNEAGKVELVQGAVTVTAPDRSTRAPKQGDMLYEGDAIATGADGELHAEMLDAGVIAVRPNTQMSITKYSAQGDANDTSIFGLVRGSFRSITGWIGKNNPARYRINSPTATIGVRGTDHEPLVIPEGSAEGAPGTYDKVAAGGSFIQGKTGTVNVTPGKAGFFAQNGRERPRLLDRVPAFFRPGRNDARLEGRHDQIRKVIEQRRSERRQFIQTRRTQRAQAEGLQRREAAQARQAAAQQRRQQAQTQRPQGQQQRVQGAEARRQRAEELREERAARRAHRP